MMPRPVTSISMSSGAITLTPPIRENAWMVTSRSLNCASRSEVAHGLTLTFALWRTPAPLLRLQLHLEAGDAAQVEPGAVGSADEPEHDLVTGRAASDHARGVRIDAGLPHRAGGPARDALPYGGGDIDRENLAQRPGEHVSVQVLVHCWPPDGPNRSVLIVPGSWPASTRRSASGC